MSRRGSIELNIFIVYVSWVYRYRGSNAPVGLMGCNSYYVCICNYYMYIKLFNIYIALNFGASAPTTKPAVTSTFTSTAAPAVATVTVAQCTTK